MKNGAQLVLSTYFMADEIGRYLSNETDVAQVVGVCRRHGVARIYLETFRNGFQVSADLVARARDRLRAAGVDTAGAVCTTRYGEPGTVLTDFPCLTHDRSRRALDRIFTFAASLFDTILIDEYIWSHCRCAACRTAKGDRSWTRFRCDQLRQVVRDHAVAPARAVNPGVRLIYKLPAMYEMFARQGQDVDHLLQEFDGIWVGTEVGPFQESPQNALRSQGPYRAWFLMGWMNELAGSKLGGAWIMPLQDTAHTLDSAYQTLLGAPRELVLHPYGGLGPDYRWAFPGGAGQFPALARDAGAIRELTRIVRAYPVRGLVAARPSRAEPWDFGSASDANVFDYVGQLGIPLRPAHDFPDDAEGFFLSLHTRSFPDFAARIEFLRGSSLPMLVTDGLAATLDRAFLDRPNVHVIEASVDYPAVVDFAGEHDPYDKQDRLRPVRGARAAWEALANDSGWDLSMKYLGDVRMAARVLGIQLRRTDLDPAFADDESGPRSGPLPLDDLRAALLGSFGCSLRGPTRVSMHLFGDLYLVLHNFNGFAVTVELETPGAAGLEPVLTLPATARYNLEPAGAAMRLEVDAHTLICLRRLPYDSGRSSSRRGPSNRSSVPSCSRNAT